MGEGWDAAVGLAAPARPSVSNQRVWHGQPVANAVPPKGIFALSLQEASKYPILEIQIQPVLLYRPKHRGQNSQQLLKDLGARILLTRAPILREAAELSLPAPGRSAGNGQPFRVPKLPVDLPQ